MKCCLYLVSGAGAPTETKPSSLPPPPSDAGAVRVQKEFVTTPLFHTTTTSDGIATVNFTAPDNLGSFIVRAYVATGVLCPKAFGYARTVQDEELPKEAIE